MHESKIYNTVIYKWRNVENPTLIVPFFYTTQSCSQERKGITLLVTVLIRSILFLAVTNRVSHTNANTVKSIVPSTLLCTFPARLNIVWAARLSLAGCTNFFDGPDEKARTCQNTSTRIN